MSFQRRVKAGELWAGCRELCHGAACLWAFRYHHLPLLGRQKFKMAWKTKGEGSEFPLTSAFCLPDCLEA